MRSIVEEPRKSTEPGFALSAAKVVSRASRWLARRSASICSMSFPACCRSHHPGITSTHHNPATTISPAINVLNLFTLWIMAKDPCAWTSRDAFHSSIPKSAQERGGELRRSKLAPCSMRDLNGYLTAPFRKLAKPSAFWKPLSWPGSCVWGSTTTNHGLATEEESFDCRSRLRVFRGPERPSVWRRASTKLFRRIESTLELENTRFSRMRQFTQVYPVKLTSSNLSSARAWARARS